MNFLDERSLNEDHSVAHLQALDLSMDGTEGPMQCAQS